MLDAAPTNEEYNAIPTQPGLRHLTELTRLVLKGHVQHFEGGESYHEGRGWVECEYSRMTSLWPYPVLLSTGLWYLPAIGHGATPAVRCAKSASLRLPRECSVACLALLRGLS